MRVTAKASDTDISNRRSYRSRSRAPTVLKEHAVNASGLSAILALSLYFALRKRVSNRFSQCTGAHVLTVGTLYYLFQRVLLSHAGLLRRASCLMQSLKTLPRALLATGQANSDNERE